MSRHDDACDESRGICEQLFRSLQSHVPALRRSPTSSSCGFLKSGSSRFAYVYHSKTKPQVEVWCRGRPRDLSAMASRLEIRPRGHQGTGWEKAFPSRFTLVASDVDEAARLLASVSLPAAAPR